MLLPPKIFPQHVPVSLNLFLCAILCTSTSAKATPTIGMSRACACISECLHTWISFSEHSCAQIDIVQSCGPEHVFQSCTQNNIVRSRKVRCNLAQRRSWSSLHARTSFELRTTSALERNRGRSRSERVHFFQDAQRKCFHAAVHACESACRVTSLYVCTRCNKCMIRK